MIKAIKCTNCKVINFIISKKQIYCLNCTKKFKDENNSNHVLNSTTVHKPEHTK